MLEDDAAEAATRHSRDVHGNGEGWDPASSQSQSRKEMWLTGEKYDWLATWSRLEKAKWLTDDLSQYDWRRRYDDFSQHRRHLQRSPGPQIQRRCEGERVRKEGERRQKEVKGEEVLFIYYVKCLLYSVDSTADQQPASLQLQDIEDISNDSTFMDDVISYSYNVNFVHPQGE